MELVLNELTKCYKDKVALDHVSGKFGPGIYGILGKNGAGKSTFMRLLSDTIKRSEGQILFDGTDILVQKSSFRRVLGYMPQEMGIYEEMTAREFLYYIARLKGIQAKAAKKQIEELLFVVNLYEEQNIRLEKFSGGMKQRVLFASSLLGFPKVILLDEPSAGLDPGERIRMRQYIKRLGQDKIVFLATHIVSDIEQIADEILIMKQGKLIARDTPENLIEKVQGYDLEDVYLQYIEEKENAGN